MKHTKGDVGIAVPRAVGLAIKGDVRFNSDNRFDESFVQHLRSIAPDLLRSSLMSVYTDFLPADVWWRSGDPPGKNREYPTAVRWKKPIIFFTPTVYPGQPPQIDNAKFHTAGPEYYCMYYENYNNKIDWVTPSKDFNCLISRMDPIRQSWLYLLIRRKLFDRGYVSFTMDNSRITEFDNVPAADAFELQYNKYMSNFEAEHNFAKSIVPYRNFDIDQDLDELIMQSKFTIVLETYSSDNSEITFTEKIIRSLRLPRPWLLFSVQYGVKQLSSWGFDTLDDIVDHSYDSIENSIERQSAILDIAERMCDFDVELHRDRLMQASDHNMKLLRNWQENLDSFALRDAKLLLDKIYNLYGTDK